MHHNSQSHKLYLQNVQLILGLALINKPHFFQPTNDFNAEREQLAKEQAEDLKEPCLFWWESVPLTESEYFNQLAEIHG